MKSSVSLAFKALSLLVVLANLQKFAVKAYQCDVPDDWIFSNASTRNFYRGAIWPNGIVKYQLDSSLTLNDLIEALRAFDDIQSKTCIRFQERTSDDQAYTNIEVDENVCGLGHVCYTGGAQYAKFGRHCRNWNTMVHELGHNLCLGHEHSRSDRDDYIQFSQCTEQELIPGKDTNNYSLRGSLYDYTSQMHYECGWCRGGWPKQREVTKCGHQVQNGLSVMDADKLNDLYNCGGCYAHRWRPIDSLTAEDRDNMVSFGNVTNPNEGLYACRGVINGELCVGKYRISTGVCYLPYGGREHLLRRNAQVFTAPSGGSSYRVVNIADYRRGNVTGEPVRSGNTRDAGVGYIALATIIPRRGPREPSIGKVFERNWNEAHFPYAGGEVKSNSYRIVVCGE